MLVKAQHAIELEQRKMLAEARAEIARLVVVTAERVLAKKLSDADRAAYNEAAAKELTVV
jgi:F-type H+-transporting ATPase subunit b